MIEVWTTDELAKMLKVDPVTLRKLAARGEFGAFKVASEYRFTHEGVLAQIEKNRVAQQQEAKAS